MRRVIAIVGMLVTVGCGNVDTTPPEAAPVDQTGPDADSDGITDADDHLPCTAVRLLVTNEGVNGVRIALDDAPVVFPDSFPTTDVIEVFLNVRPGTNALELLGSAPDHEEIHLIVEDDDKSTRFLDQVLTRDAATPAEIALGFDVSTSCAN